MACATVALADKLVLIDGRTFTGTVTVEGDTVVISVPYGALRFSKNQVERIELKDTPEQEFRKKLGETPLDDPNALFDLAQWADKESLNRQASHLYALILKLNAEHAPTRRMLGYARIDGKWQTFEQGVEQARGKLAAGSYAALLDDVLPALRGIATAREQHVALAELLGHTQLRSQQFGPAGETFGDLAKKAEGPLATRSAAIAQILGKSPDGLYVLRETYPPSATLLGGASPSIEPGPASLSNPLVLQAALRNVAKKRIGAGKELMDQAQKLERTDPDAAAGKYTQAGKVFGEADALVPNIARSYRVEIARRKIAAIRKDADADARKFDEAKQKLGVTDMSPQAYRNMILRLVHHLDGTRDNLKKIAAIAEPFPRELFLEVKWAELDLTKIEGMRKILMAELDGRK